MRSSQYDTLLAAEARAQKNQTGVHSKGDAPVHRVTDINSKALADRFYPSLQRQDRITAVVEYVTSGSRLRVYLPKDTCTAVVVLAGRAGPLSHG